MNPPQNNPGLMGFIVRIFHRFFATDLQCATIDWTFAEELEDSDEEHRETH